MVSDLFRTVKQVKVYRIRIVNDRSLDHFKILSIDSTPISLLCNENDLNTAYKTFLDIIPTAYNKAFPVAYYNLIGITMSNIQIRG